MGVAERYNKKQNKQENTSVGAVKRRELRFLENELNSLVESIGSNSQSIYNAYKSRFFDENENYKNVYRADTKEALKQYTNFKTKYNTDSKKILNYLDKYGSYLDEKFVSNIKDWLKTSSEDFDKIYTVYKRDYKTFSPYKDENEYNNAVKAKEIAQEEYDELASYNLEARWRDIKYYESELAGIEATEKGIQDLESKEQALFLSQSKGDKEAGKELKKNQELQAAYRATLDAAYKKYGNKTELESYISELKQKYTKAEQLQKNNRHNAEVDALYAKYSANKDWEEQSKYISTENIDAGLWDAMTGNKYNDIEYEERNHYMPGGQMGVTDPYYSAQLTAKEKALFNYIYHTQGKEAGLKWHDSFIDILKKRSEQAHIDQMSELAEEMPVVSDILSVFASAFSGGEYIVDLVMGEAGDTNLTAASASAIRKTRSEQVDWEIGDWDAFDFLYNTTMSAADSVASVSMFGSAGGTVALGLSAAAQGTNDALERGMSKDQAFWNGLASGVFEALFESVSIGKFNALKNSFKPGIKNAAKDIAKLMLVNASEETLTEVANILYDTIANGDFSQAETAIRQYMSMGLSESDAKRKVALELGAQIVESGASGALMGFGFGAGGRAIGAISQNRYYKNTYGDQQAELVAEGLKSADGTLSKELATKYQKVLDSGKSLKGRHLGNLVKANESAFFGEDTETIKQAVSKRLIDLGETGNVDLISSAITKALLDEGFTKNEINAFYTSKYASKVLHELNPENVKSSGKSSWAAGIATTKINAEAYNLAFEKASQELNAAEQIKDGMVSNPSGKMTALMQEKIKEGNKISEENGVSVKKITSIGKDGKMMVETDNGTVEDANDIQFKSHDDGYIILSTSNMATELNKLGIDLDVTSANAVVNGFSPNSGISAEDYMKGAYAAIRYGVIGFKREGITKNSPYHNLTESQQKYLYEIGRLIAEKTNYKEDSGVKASSTSTSKKSKNGKVTKAYKSKLTPNQATAVSTVEKLSEVGILKNNFYFYESQKGQAMIDGKYKSTMVFATDVGMYKKGDYAPNGFYQAENGDIYIDINSGANGEGLTLYTLAHELGHFVKHQNPTGFKVLADFVADELGIELENLIQNKLDLWKKLGRTELNYMDAYEDVICDALEPMFTDGNLAQKLVEHSKSSIEGKGLLKTLKEFFENLYKRIQKAYKELSPDDPAARSILKNQESVEKLADLFAKAIVGANENFVSAEDIVADAKPISPDEIITDGATVTAENGEKFSLRSIKEDIADGQMFEDLKTHCGWTEERVSNLKTQLESLVEYMTPYRDILDMNETYGREGRRFSPYKPNSDPLYKISMDFSTLCSKRLLTQYVIEQLQLRENRPMSAEEQMAIRDMLKEYGKREKALQVACVMCYVEAARLKSPKQINKWLNDPATQMKNYFADKDPNFSQYIKDAQADFKASKGYSRNATKREMSSKDVTALNKIRPKLRANYKPTAEESAIIEQVKSLPNSTYLTAGNLADLSESHPEIYKAYTAFIRTATRSKSLETDEPYYYGDSRRDNGNGIIVSDSFIEAVNRENGMRFSSWSDWRIQHLLDYIVAVIDNSVRGAAMHGYTKFGDEIRVLGKTGMMFNMSGVPGTQNGLNEDGSLSFSDTESMDYNEAIALREEFPETAGLQCIGVSKEHIIALLRDPIIDYVIPYHTSGLNATLRRMGDIYGWSDFTHSQHATEDSSIKKENAIDKEHWRIEPVFSEFFVGYDTKLNGVEAMKKSADNYIRMCKERGLKPKFEEFTNEENYWKLLIDRKMVNQKTNTLIKQKAVTPEFDFDAIKGIVDKYVENYDSSLEQKALNHIVENWDSVPKRIRDLKKQGTAKAKSTKKSIDTLANETLSAQPKQEVLESKGDKFSLRQIIGEDGTNYGVGVYLDSTLLTDLTDDERITMVKEYIKEIGGSTFSAFDKNGDEVDVYIVESHKKFKNSKGKKVFVNQHLTNYLKNPTKQETIALVDELIFAAKQGNPEPAHHPHDWLDNNGQNDWEYWTTYIQDKENTIWEATLQIANSTNGEKILYEIHPIKKVEGVEQIDTTSTNDSIPQEDTESQELFSNPHSDRDYRLNNRNLLANALESTAKNEVEREWLARYKAQITSLNEDQKRLDEINAEIKKISFTKGSDRSKLTALNNNKKTLTARITRADKKLLEFEASKPLKNVLEAEKKRATQKAMDKARKDIKAEREKASKREQKIWEKAKERVQAQKDRASKREQELKDKYTDIIERNKEGRDKTALRHKIKKTVSYLNSIFNRGTKERNVKLGLQDTVSRALATAEILFSEEITNADIVKLGVESVTDKEMKYLGEYNNLLYQLDSAKEEDIPSIKAKISRLNSLLKNVFIREKARLNRQTVDYALNSLAEAYRDLKNSPDDYIKKNSYVEGMYDRIISLKDDLKGVTIKDMSLEQLESVYKIYNMVRHMVTEANSIFRDGRREDLATTISNVQAEIDAIVSSSKDRTEAVEKVADFVKTFAWNELKPYAAFERLGSKTFEKLFWDTIEADNVWARDWEEAGKVIEEARKKYKYKKWDMQTATTFKSSNGLKFKLTLGDMMSIYAYSKRPQALDHMTIGGFQFDTGKTYKEKRKENGLKITYRHKKLSETYKVDPKLIGDFIAAIEKIEGVKEYVDEIQSYLTKLGEKGNEVSRILFGIDLFKEKVYFPLQSAQDYRSSVEQTLNATQTMASLKNTGVSKETVPHANNPIVLKSFDDVVLEHINTMAKYHAYVIPIENLSKVFNNVGKDAINGDYLSTQALISSKFGDAATKYFDQFITDLNGGTLGGGAKNPLDKLFGTAKGVSVAANMSVVVQQYFAVIRAMDEINPKYMIPFLNGEASKSDQKQWEELKKYAPISIIKEMGGFDMGANRTAIDNYGDVETKLDAKKVGKKVKDASMWLAGKMDEIGWSTIWRAVKKEIADTTDLDVGTEEFYQACGKRFTEIIVKTQVYDSVTSRSGYMRSKHGTVKYLTSFMGEPTAIVNMMYLKQLEFVRAIKSKDMKAIKKASQNLMRGSAVLILSTVLTSLAKSLPYAMRDDEEEEDALLERWAKHFGDAIASDMNPLNMLPIGRDLVSIWEGWDVERPDMTLISDIFTTIKKAIDDGCTTDEALALAGSLANILGYPLKNVIRDAKGVIRLFNDVTDDIDPEYVWDSFVEGFTGASSQDILWDALVDNDTDKLNALKREYKTEASYNSAVRKALKENDPRIKEAAEARISGDFDTYKQIVLEIKAEGHFSQDDIISAINSTITTLKKEIEEEDTTEWYNEESEEAEEEETSVYKGSDVNDALEMGDIAKAKEIIKDIVNAKVKSGKTEAQAKSSIKSSIASYWKPIYRSASNEEKIEIRKMLRRTGIYSSATEIVKLTRKWEQDSD